MKISCFIFNLPKTPLLGAAAVVLAVALGAAQEKTTSQKTESTTEQKNESSRKFRRLPPFYSQVISPLQRRKMYVIYDKYEAQLEELKKQMRELVAKRDAELETHLYDDQRKELHRLQAEAKAKREAERKRRLAEEEAKNPTKSDSNTGPVDK